MNGDSSENYKILSELGKGSYGVVYKIQCKTDIKVLKQIDINHMTEKQQHAALKEVQILKQLNHPNVIKYHSSFISKGIIHIIMEYAEQGDLMMYLRSQKINFPINETFIWSIAFQLTEAIAHLHSRNIMHRDIKPLNIFLMKDHQLKLGDLGVSKIMNEQFPSQGTRVGTPLYLAPELVQHQPYDSKIDIWSLGCVLYFICAMKPPFKGDNLIQLGINIVNKQPKPINQFYSSRLHGFIKKLLSKNPSSRPSILEIQAHFCQPEYKLQQNQQIIYSTVHRLDNDSKLSLAKDPFKSPVIVHVRKNTSDSQQKMPTDIEELRRHNKVPCQVSRSPTQQDRLRDILISEHNQKLKQQISQPILKKFLMKRNQSQEDRFKQIIQKLGDKACLDSNVIRKIQIEKNFYAEPKLSQSRIIKQYPVRNHRPALDEFASRKFKASSLHQQRDTSRGKIKDYMRVNFVPNSIDQDESIQRNNPKEIVKSVRQQSPNRVSFHNNQYKLK